MLYVHAGFQTPSTSGRMLKSFLSENVQKEDMFIVSSINPIEVFVHSVVKLSNFLYFSVGIWVPNKEKLKTRIKWMALSVQYQGCRGNYSKNCSQP